MTARVQINRSDSTGVRPGFGSRAVGELFLNAADVQLSYIHPAASLPLDLLPVRRHSTSAAYAVWDWVLQSGQLRRARAAIPAHAFVAAEWATWLDNLGLGTAAPPTDLAVGALYANASLGLPQTTGLLFNSYSSTAGERVRATGNSARVFHDSAGLHMQVAPSAAANATPVWQTAIFVDTGGITLTKPVSINQPVSLTNWLSVFPPSGIAIDAGVIQGTRLQAAAAGNPTVMAIDSSAGVAGGFYYGGASRLISFGEFSILGAGYGSYWTTFSPATGEWQFPTSVRAAQNGYFGGGLYIGATHGYEFQLYDDPATGNKITNYRAGHYDLWRGSDGNRFWLSHVGAIMQLTADGQLTIAGTGRLVAATVNLTGDATADNFTAGGTVASPVIFGSSLVHGPEVKATTRTTFNAGDPGGIYYSAYQSGPLHVLEFAPNWYLSWNRGDGTLMFAGPDGARLIMHGPAAVFQVVNTAIKPGGGPWSDTSDARVKDVRGDYTHGLDELLHLQPRIYVFNGSDGAAHQVPAAIGTEYIGLVAQETEPWMPELVTLTEGTIDGEPVTDMRHLDTTPLVFALINAVRTLHTRIQTLEAQTPT